MEDLQNRVLRDPRTGVSRWVTPKCVRPWPAWHTLKSAATLRSTLKAANMDSADPHAHHSDTSTLIL